MVLMVKAQCIQVMLSITLRDRLWSHRPHSGCSVSVWVWPCAVVHADQITRRSAGRAADVDSDIISERFFRKCFRGKELNTLLMSTRAAERGLGFVTCFSLAVLPKVCLMLDCRMFESPSMLKRCRSHTQTHTHKDKKRDDHFYKARSRFRWCVCWVSSKKEIH